MKPEVWSQLKNITAEQLIKSLERDGWVLRKSVGSARLFKKLGKRVSVHFHPKKTYSPNQLAELLKDIGWSEEDLRRLKLIK